MSSRSANAWVWVPRSPSVIVTATFGSVFESALCTVMIRCACWARLWLTGKLAAVTSTLYFPLTSFASCRAPPPHADSATLIAAQARIPQLLDLQLLNARGTYHAQSAQ